MKIDTDALKKQVILHLPYLLFLLVFAKLGEAVRLAPGADASQKLLGLSEGFSLAFQSMWPGAALDWLVGLYLLTNCFTIVMAVFDVAQNVVSQSAGVINGNMDVTAALADLETQLEAMGMWELIGLWLETNIINLCMWVLSIVIFVIVYGRMIEIYLTVSLAPIPFSTMANREWGQMGTNYLRSLFALGFQGFLILVCVAIYAVLVQSIPSSGDIHGAIWGTAGYTVLLAFALFKTGSLSKSIFNSH